MSQKNGILRVPGKIRRKLEQPIEIAFRRIFWNQFQIVIGSLIAACGFSVFQVPFNLAAGGVTGLGIIINHFNGFPVGMMVLAMNVPLAFLGFYYLGRWRFLSSTVLSVFIFSFGIDFFNAYLPAVNEIWPITDDMLLASIYAGVLYGVGIGLIYRVGGTIGGSSIPARIFYERLGYPMSQSYLFTDGAIIFLAGLVFQWEVALLATLTLVLSGIFTDFVTEGVSQVRTATIVTKKPEDVRWAIIYQLRRGVSLWPVEGGYSKTARTMVFCTILRSRLAELKYAVTAVDPDAFIVVGVAQQVVGGYGKRLPSSKIGHADKNGEPEAIPHEAPPADQ